MEIQSKLLAFQVFVLSSLQEIGTKIKKFANDERGDTNFISIIVVLALVLVVAAIFLVFRNQIIDKAKELISNFIGSDWDHQ